MKKMIIINCKLIRVNYKKEYKCGHDIDLFRFMARRTDSLSLSLRVKKEKYGTLFLLK